MGYYSTVEVTPFKSAKSPEECEAARNRFLKAHSDKLQNRDMLTECRFQGDKKVNGAYTIYTEFPEGYHQKWEVDTELKIARFIAALILPETNMDIYIQDEDSMLWGVRVYFMRVVPLTNKWVEEKKYAFTLAKTDVLEVLL